MAHEPTEDITGDIDPFALVDEERIEEEDKKLNPQNSLIKELRAYCKKAIAEHNSFDVLSLPQNATPEQKVAVFDEMFNHKGLVHHLRQIESIINDKVKEN
jgi:hypothetical protein